jgi:cell division protein FtsI/penicillin-binding protein 2
MKSKLARFLFIGSVSLCLILESGAVVLFASRTTSSQPSTARSTSKKKSAPAKKAGVSKRKKATAQGVQMSSNLKNPGKVIVTKRGRRVRIRSVDPTVGDNVEGEDMTVRRAAVEALGTIDGSIVVVDPSNGRVLSIVNQKVALGGGYQPCSTFKLAVSLAGLSEGVFSKDSEFRCPYRGYLNLTDALAYSCNSYFQTVGQRLGFDRVKKYAKEFGFGERAGLGIEGERPGVFPEEIKEQWIRLLSSHGQFIEVTPLEMAAFASAIANEGTLYYLQYPRSPEEISAFEPKIKRRLSIAHLLPDLKEGMSGSVTYGSGRHAYDPMEPIYGKTGSCSGQGTHLGWFVSYAGDADHKVAVVVLTRGSKYTEGPFAAMIAGKLYRGLSQRNYFAQRNDNYISTSTTNNEDQPATARNPQR